jgi:hypothetical protein
MGLTEFLFTGKNIEDQVFRSIEKNMVVIASCGDYCLRSVGYSTLDFA